jgi:hypothetical protein
VAEVRLLVLGSQFPQKLNAGIVKKLFFDLPGCQGTVERQQMMAG